MFAFGSSLINQFHMSTQLFSKFKRPEQPRRGIVSERDLDIIEAILRYRFSPASQLTRLVGGNEDVTFRRLRILWEKGLVNRWAFPGIRTHSEFHYYLDNREALDLLVAHCRLNETLPQMLEEIRYNREKDYAAAALRGQHMQLGFLQHSLMISRMHFMLEMAGRQSNGQVVLEGWRQGAELRGPKVNVPEIKSRRIEGGSNYVWEEQSKTQKFPVEPDALFSLRFLARSTEPQVSHFCYEADRGSMPMSDMRTKLRAYRHSSNSKCTSTRLACIQSEPCSLRLRTNHAPENLWISRRRLSLWATANGRDSFGSQFLRCSPE